MEKSCKHLAFPSLFLIKALELVGTIEQFCSVASYDKLDRLNLIVVSVVFPLSSEMASLDQPRVESLVPLVIKEVAW